MRARQRVEREQGAPIELVLRALRDEGLMQRQAAERLGVSAKTVCKWGHKFGVLWPQNKRSVAALKNVVQGRPTTRWLVVDGERMTLGEYAKRHGAQVDGTTLRYRYDRGLRGADLVGPPKRGGGPKFEYRLGLTEREWRVVLDEADRIGPILASRRLHIPVGAINAMRSGEAWRVS